MVLEVPVQLQEAWMAASRTASVSYTAVRDRELSPPSALLFHEDCDVKCGPC